MSNATYLYRHYSADGALLYVGISLSIEKRTKQHSLASRWFEGVANITIQRFDSRDEAITAERKTIADEKPKYNIQHNNRQVFRDFPPTRAEIEKSQQQYLSRIVSFKLLYTIGEAASQLGVSKNVVLDFMNRKKLSFVTIRERKQITGWQLIDFLENLEREGEG